MDLKDILFRQVHPKFVQGDSVSTQVFTSQTFRPTEKDDNLLSVYNENNFTAEESYSHYTDQGYESAGVVGVSKEECDGVELPVNEDNDPFEGHCSIDYNGLSSNSMKNKGKKLKNLASTRGWIFVDSQ